MEPDEELVQLKTLVGQLKDLIRSKDDEVQEKSNALKESESKLSKSKLQLKAKDAKISSLSKQLSARPKKSEDASQKHDWNTDLKKNLHEKESTIKQQLKIIREQDQKIADLQKDANGKGKQTEQAASTNSQDARKIEELTQSITNKDELIGTISTQVQELQNTIHIKNEEMQAMQGRLIETQTLSDQQKLLLDKLTTTVAQQEEKVAMVSEKRSTGLSHLQDNVAELAEEVVSLQSRLQDKEGTVSILEAHILQLKREHKTQMDDIMSGNEEQDELLRTLKRRMHEQDEVMSGKEKVLQLLQDEAADKVQEHEELRRTISILQQTLRETVESKELLQEALKSQERSGGPSQAGLIPSSLLEEKDKLIAEKDNIIRELSASLQQQDSIERTDALQEECLTLKEKVRSLQESVEKWQALAQDSSEALELKEEEFKLTVNNFEETVKSVTDELAQTKKLYDELVLDSEKRMKTVLMELDSQTKVLEKQTKEMNSLLQEKELLENQSTGAASELSADVASSSDSTEKEYNDLKDKHSQAISDIENLRKQNESLLHDMKTREEKLQSSQAENASLKESVRDLEEKEDKLNARLRDLDDDYAQLIEEFASKEDILTATWNQQRNDLLKELQQVEQRCRQESKAEIDSLQNQASDLSLKLDDTIKREHESSDKLKSAEIALQDLKLTAEKNLEEFEMTKQSIIKEYEEKCADLSERNRNLVTDIERHVSTCQNLSEELDNSRRENLSSKEQLEALKSLYDSSNHELKSVQNQLETLQGSSTVVSQELNATLRNLENEKGNLVTALESLERDKNMSEEKLSEHILVLTGDLNNNTERIQTLSTELEAQTMVLKTLTEEKETALEMIKEKQDLVRDLEERLTSANKEKSDLESQFDGMDDIRSANETLMSTNKSLEEGLRKAKNEIAGLTSAQEERERQLSINSQELQRAESEKGALLDQVGVLEKRLEEKSRFCEDLEKSASELKTLCRESASKLEELQASTAEQLSSRKVEIDNLNALNLQIKKEKDDTSVEYDRLNMQFCKLQDDLSVVSSSHDRLVEENKELSTQCQDLAQNATDFETRMRVRVEEYDDKISSLQSSLAAIEQERESLLEENQGLISHVNEVSANSSSLEDRIQQDHTASEEKVASLQTLILSKDEELVAVSTQKSQLSAKVQELSEGNSSLRSEIEELRKYQKDASDLMATFETLRESHASLEVHKNTLSAQLESTMEEVNLLKSERDKGKEIFQKVIKDLQTALDSVTKEKQSLDQECAAKSNENVALNVELQKLSVSCEEQNSKLLNLRRENEALENKVKDLYSENADLDEKLRESATKYENQITELETAASRYVEEKELLQKCLDDVTSKFEAKELDVTKKVQLLEQMSTQYASLRSELQASHRLVTEMGIPALSEEVVDTEVRHDQRQASVESELEEARKKLDNVQHERDNAQHEAALLRRISRDNSHDFQEGPDSQLVSSLSGSTHKGGLEYLQSQLAELANEQEQQALEHQRVATALSEKVERITTEKDRLVESLRKQTAEFEEVLKSLQEKETECQQLDSVISEQRRDLSLVNEQLNKVSKSSDLQQRSLADLDEKCVQLQDKNKSLNDTLESQETSRHELEVELREVKSLSKKTQDRNLILDEQNEKLAHAASMLQQDLDQAMEQIEVLNQQYTDDSGKLKGLLRERDEEISLLKDDADSKRQEIESLLQTVEERNSVCSDLEERLNAQSEKVGKLQTLIRQHEAELALISELEGEKEKAAAKAKELSDYISQLENGNSAKESTIQELMSKVDSLQSDVLDKNAELDRISRENSKVQESHQRKALENESRLTGTENELLSLREQLERSAQAISSLSKTIEAKDDELTNLKELCEQRENQQFNVQEELASMQQLVQVKEESFREQLLIENEKFEQAKKNEIEALTSHLERQFEEANSHHQSKIDSLQEDIIKLRDTAALLGIEKETAQNELFDEKEKAIELQETGEKWEKEAQEKGRLCDDLQSTVNLLNERTEQASAKLREFEQENSTLRRSLSEASEKASEKENLVMKLDEALTISNSEVRKLRDQLSEESQRQVKEMDSMLTSGVEERDEHIKNLESEKSALEKNLSEAIKEQNALKETCSELENEFESVRKEHELKLEELTRQHAEDLGALNSLVEENRVTMEQITNKRKMDEAKEEAWMKTCSDLEFQLNNARAGLESTLLNLSTSNEKESELSLEVAKLNDMLNESQDATSKHQAQMEKAKKIVHGLRVQLKQSKEKNAKLEKELEKGSGENISRESDRKISEQNLTAVESETTEVETLSSSANQENHNQNEFNYRETNDDLSRKLAAEQQRSLELSDKMIENKDVIDRLENEKDQMTKTMQEIELELKNQQDNVTSMQASLVSEKEKYEGLFSSMSQKDGELNALREQLSDLEESIIVLQKEKTSFEEALNRSNEELRIASALNAESEEKVQSLRSGLSSKDSELSETANELGKYQRMYEESEMLQSSLKSNVESVSGLLATKDEECRQLTIENNALKASVDEISRDKSALDHEFQVYRDMQGLEMSAKIEELQSRFENDAKILKEFKSKCLDFESVISKKDEAIRSLELETENLKESVSNRSEELNKSVVECESLKKELKIAEDSIRESDLKLQAVIEEHQDSKVGDEEISQKFKSQIRQLSTELQSLQSVNDTLKENLQNSENEIGSYKQVFEDLKSKLAVAEERSGATESRYLSILDEKDAELKQIRDAYEQSNVGMVNLKEELSSVRQKHNDTVAEMLEKLARLEDEKSGSQQKYQDFSANDDSRRAHNTLQQADDSQNTSCDDSKDKIPQLEKQLQEKSKSLAEAQRKLKASLVSRKSVMEKLKSAEKKLKGIESGVEVSVDDQNVSLNQSFDSTAGNDSKILTEINEENATLKSEVADATDRIVKLESELGKEKERSSNIDIEISELRERCEHLSSQIENKNSEYDTLQNRLEEIKSQLADMEALYNEKETAFNNEIREISGCLESKQAECASLQDDLSAILDEKENLASKVDALTADLRRKESEWDELRTADSESELLQSRLNEQEERNSEMNIVISDLEHDLEKARSSRKEMEIRIESLEWKLVEFDRVSKECDNERQNAEAARQELEEERATRQESQLRYGDEIAALKTDLASMKEEKDRFEIECLTLKKEKGRASAAAETEQVRLLQKSSDNAVKERELLQRKLKAALVSRKELIVQEKEMKEELAELRGYRDKYHESDGALRDLSEREKAKDEELAEMKGRREKDVRILKESRKKLANLEKEISEKERAVQEEIQKREEIERTLADWSERLKNKEGEIATLESCNEDLNEIVMALESKNKGLQKKLEEDIETIRGLRKEIKTISEGDASLSKADLTELSEKLEAAEWDRDSLQETVSRLEAEKREKASMLDKVLEDFQNESIAEQETAGRCSELEAELNGLKLEMNELRESMAHEKGIIEQETLQQTIRDLNDALGSAEREHAIVVEQKHILESRLKEMEESQEDKITLKTLARENTDLRESVASLRETISALEDEKESLKNDRSQLSNDEEKKISLDTLVQENNDLRESVASLRETISTLEGDKDILQTGRSQLSNDVDNKIHLATLVQENNNLKESVASLRETIATLEDEKESLLNDRSQPPSPFRASSISTDIPDDPRVLDQDVLLAKRTILEETLGQLKVTQPDNWEQQPGIMKLIDKLEYLAEKAACAKKEEARQREVCENAQAHANKMELQLSSARETVDMNERTIEQLTHEVSGLRGRVMELETDDDDSSALHELAQLEDEYKRVLSESRLQTVSFGEIEKKRKQEKATLEERIEGLENERDALIRDLDLKSGEMEDLKGSVAKLVPPKNRTYSESSREGMGSMTKEPGVDKTSTSPLGMEIEIDETQIADDTTTTLEIENIQRSSADTTRELENREELIAELLSDCKRLKTEGIIKSDIAASLETEASALRSELKSLACLKTQYESNENHLKSELAEKDRVLQRLKSELAYSRTEQERLRNEFGAGTPQEVQTILNAYLGDINNLKSTLFATSNALDAKERDVTDLNDEVRRKQDEIESLTLEMEALTEKHGNIQVLVQDMQQQVESLSQENESYRSQLDEFGDISKTLDDKETTINALTSDKDALNTSLIDSESLVSELQRECSQLRADLESSSLLLEERQNLIATLAEERDKNLATESENTTFRERIDDLGAELEAKNSALKAIFEQKETLSVDLKERDARVESLENENVQLRATAESADAKLSEIEREYAAYVKTNKDQRHRVSVAESSLSSLTGQLAALHDRYSVASRVLDQVAVTMPAPKVTDEILVKSADREDSDVRLLSAESLKEKNPLVRLERKLESYEKALVWVDGEKARLEIENAQKRDELESLRVSYEENALELERVQEEFMEATAALRDLERQIDEQKVINRRLESQLEGMNTELQEARSNIQRGEIAERDAQTQRQQIEQLLSERQQLANQLHTTHSSLQEYQSSYTGLLSEYKRLTAQLNEGSAMSTPEKQHNGTLDQGAPGGPPVRALSGSPEHDSIHQSLDTVRAERSQLAIKLAQVQSQLSDEIQHRTEVEDLLQNLRQNQSALESVRVVSDEDEPILMKPSSIVRKVRSSTSTSCSRWLRGRSLRWANSTSARPCRHFRPLSIQTLIILYFIGLHILIIKCFLL